MDVNLLQRHFTRIGARAQVRWLERSSRPVALDITRDRSGELFDIRLRNGESVDLEVLHLEPKQRHLLLMSRSEENEKHKFLCGHDERHWFVAAVPEDRSVSTVRTAIEALKPREIAGLQLRLGVRTRDRNRRRNAAFIRQGEWFFVPEPGLVVNERLVLTNEPLRRSNNGKPHMVEFLYRMGGETVFVCSRYRSGITEPQYYRLLQGNPNAASWNWRVMKRNPQVFVRGRVRHSDHATIELDGWHRVLMNTENQAAAMRHVAFLD